jgi:hypothetical protein
MTVYVLGGGPAGLALVDGLCADTGTRFVVVERDAQLGGLARTVQWDGIGAHDLGPHKIFTTDKALFDRVRGLLPATEWLTRPKKSSIYMRGHYLPYPPSPFSLGRVSASLPWGDDTRLPLCQIAFAGGRIGGAHVRGRPFHTRRRTALWGAVPADRAETGDPARLDVKLSQGRVQTPSLWSS